jgi:uncharacterized protein involved in response to NO
MAANHQARRPGRGHRADKLFFPAAAAYTSIAVPASVHGIVTGNPIVPGFAGVAGHAHELLFGFALAVVAGFLVNRASAYGLSALFSLWLIARGSYWLHPDSLTALLASSGFAVAIITLAVPPFWRGAKRWRNKAIAPLLVALSLMPLLFHLPRLLDSPWLRFIALEQAVILLALLMLFMGGRLIAPAAAGAIQQAGGRLEARVQPRLEASLIIVMGVLVIAVTMPRANAIAGLASLVAAGIALVRLLRWQLWAAKGRADLWCLGIGMGWLVLGLALLGMRWLGLGLTAGTSTHAITMGALGTLTTGIMARVWLLKRHHAPAEWHLIPVMAALISASTLLRLSVPNHGAALACAAAGWSLAYLLLLGLMYRARRTPANQTTTR